MSDKTTCTICGSMYRSCDRTRHLLTSKHKKAVEESNEEVPVISTFNEESVNMENPFEILLSPESNPNPNEDIPVPTVNFNSLYNDKDKSKPVKPVVDEKEVIIDKINKMLILFDTEFEKEKQALPSETLINLKARLRRMELSVNSSCINNFISDAITSTLLIIEPNTANSLCDIRGLSGILKANKDFIRQCKLMSIKYGGYSNLPVELQLMFTISISAYVVISKNKNSDKIKDILNEPYIPKITTKQEKLPEVITLKL